MITGSSRTRLEVPTSILKKVSKENQNAQNRWKGNSDGPIAWNFGLSNTVGNTIEHVRRRNKGNEGNEYSEQGKRLASGE